MTDSRTNQQLDPNLSMFIMGLLIPINHGWYSIQRGCGGHGSDNHLVTFVPDLIKLMAQAGWLTSGQR